MTTFLPMTPNNVWPGQTHLCPNGHYTGSYWPVAPANFTPGPYFPMHTPALAFHTPALSVHTPGISVHTPLSFHTPAISAHTSCVPFIPCTPCTPHRCEPPPQNTPCPIHVCLLPNGSESGFPILDWNFSHNPISARASGKQKISSLLREFAIPTNGGDIELEIVIRDVGASRFVAEWGPVRVRRKKGTKGPFTVEDVLLSIVDYLHVPLTWERGELSGQEKTEAMRRRAWWLANQNHFWPIDSTPWTCPRRLDVLRGRNFGGLTVNGPISKGWQLVMNTV